MKRICALLLIMLASTPLSLLAQSTTVAPRQEPNAIRQVAQQFLEQQSAGLPGRVEIKVGTLDSRLNMPACAALEAFMPPGSKAWGKTTVGVRCNAPSPWTLYLSSSVQVWADYLAATSTLAQGQVLTPADLTRVSGDLTSLPAGVLTDLNQASGRTLALSLAAGSPLRRDALRQQQAVQMGQTVRLVSNGPGFRISTEAKALANAMEGQPAQARTAGGTVVSGIARAGGVIEVSY